VLWCLPQNSWMISASVAMCQCWTIRHLLCSELHGGSLSGGVVGSFLTTVAMLGKEEAALNQTMGDSTSRVGPSTCAEDLL
jgi:hypothetical protein